MAESTRKTVLVVDDDGDIRETLEMTLRYEGFDVWTARDGKEALARMLEILTLNLHRAKLTWKPSSLEVMYNQYAALGLAAALMGHLATDQVLPTSY